MTCVQAMTALSAKPGPSRHALLGGLVGLLALALTADAQDWQSPPDKITVLVVNAHPDDEGIFFGGAMPYYNLVVRTPAMLLSMTSGDWRGPQMMLTREQELRTAAWIYGFRYEPLFPRFKDIPSGTLATNPYPNRIDLTWDWWADGVGQGPTGLHGTNDVAEGQQRAINYVAEQIRRYRPDIIITHDAKGEYGHDNHKATCIAVTNAFFVAADPAAMAPNLVGLPPWQASKLYLHLWPENALFHTDWEELTIPLGGTNASPRRVANLGLDAHVSQGAHTNFDVSSAYTTGGSYDGYDSEWWGLYASTVGADTVLTSNRTVRGYVVTNGATAGNFLENVLAWPPASNTPPMFVANPLRFSPVGVDAPYTNRTLADFALDLNPRWTDTLTFQKTSGPDWLSVAGDGALTGVPQFEDIGTNAFVVRVADSAGAWAEATLLLPVVVLPPPPGPLAAIWRCNEGEGDTAFDASGCGNHARLTNGATWGDGHTGAALAFDGVDDHALAPNLFLGSELTIAAWIYPTNLTGDRGILGETAAYTFKTSGTGLKFTTPGIKDHTVAAGLQVGQWRHVAVTFQASTAKGCRIYTNGVLVGTVDASAKNTSANATLLGANQFPNQFFAGRLDDLRVYRYAMDSNEVFAVSRNLNLRPVTTDDTFVMLEDTPRLLPVLANDVDLNADPLSLYSVGYPTTGTAEMQGTNILYTPATNFHGLASFRYVVTDGTLLATGTVTLTILQVNDPPQVWDANFWRAPGAGLSIPIADVLAHTSDVEGDPRTLVAVGPGQLGATIVTNATHIVYTPPPGAAGNAHDALAYTVSDGQGGMATANLLIWVGVAEGFFRDLVVVSNQVGLEFVGLPEYRYDLQRSTNLNTWTTVATNLALPPEGLTYWVLDARTNSPAFYRLQRR